MKKSVIVLLLIGMLVISPLVLAQEQSETYSSFNRFTNNLQLFFSGGDNKVQLALEIREKEINSAIVNSQNQDEKEAIKNLENAHKKLQIVNEKISLDVADEVKESVDEIVSKIEDEENISENFDVYVLEEKKTQLIAELTQETFEYCKKLSEEDFNAMLREEECNPKTAPKNLEKELKELQKIQEEAFVKLMYEIRSCIDDPGTCNCEANQDIIQKAKCEKMVALAVKCEYHDDTSACSELISMKPVEGDGFAESFVPEDSEELYKKYEKMIDYEIEKSDVPAECYNENERVKTQCAVFREKKELNEVCFDEEGNFLVEKCGGPKEETPTMQESIPQCYDKHNNFLEEKCGEITIIWKDGLINYIIGTEIENIVGEFENKSEQHKIEINKTEEKNNVLEVKEGINDVEDDIQDWVVEHPLTNEEGDEGLTWEIKTEVAASGDGGLSPEVETETSGGGSGGDEGLGPEVKTEYGSGGHEENNVDEGPGEPGVVDED